ncbi:MAG: isochorismatase family protein [Clostridiales Family XIII bacterium]|jgi:nicotinamidase-related amidase|nr:isochorismatase family protein [Clostridiales Family XIII bacterium]
MKITRSTIDESLLVVIDMQERLIPAMQEKERLIDACGTLIRGIRTLNVPLLFTQQYTKGLGGTITEIVAAATETLGIDENVVSAAENPLVRNKLGNFHFLDKKSFSVLRDPAFCEAFEAQQRRSVILCGIESHVCVMQSALDFLAQGCDVLLAADAASSRRQEDWQFALSRLAQAGAVVTTTEAILFDLMGSAAHPSFKAVSAIVK